MRAFLAVEVPEELRRELAALQGALSRRLDGVRWVRPEAIHLTLVFLGEIDEDVAASVVRAATAGCAGLRPGSARAAGVGRFPPSGGPRVLWVGIVQDEAATLGALHRVLSDAVGSVGLPRERRPFRPHLTLGRARRRLSPARVEAALAEVGAGAVGEIPVRRCNLYQSILGPGGARYAVRGTLPLGGAAEETSS